MEPLFKKINTIFFFLFAICIMVFLLYKAERTSFTHDESYSLTHFVYQTSKSIRTYKTPYTNNHILNSLGMKLCKNLFGNSELSLRLPNILAFLVYSGFLFLLIRRLKGLLVISMLIIGAFNPYLLDFFGLARGYGLSIAFMVASLWGIVQYLKSRKAAFLWLFQLFAFLAIYANFSLLIYYLAAISALISVIFCQSIFSDEKGWDRKQILSGLGIGLLGVVGIAFAIWEPVNKILEAEMLNFGGKSSFF